MPGMLIHAPKFPHLGNNVTAHDDLPCLRTHAVVIPAGELLCDDGPSQDFSSTGPACKHPVHTPDVQCNDQQYRWVSGLLGSHVTWLHSNCHTVGRRTTVRQDAYLAKAWFPGLGAPKVCTLSRWNLKVLLMSYAAKIAKAPPKEWPTATGRAARV